MAVDGSIIIDTQIDSSKLKNAFKIIKSSSKGVETSVGYTTDEIKAQEKEVARLSAEYAKLEAQAREWAEMGADAATQPTFMEQYSKAEDSMIRANEQLEKMKSSTAQAAAGAADIADNTSQIAVVTEDVSASFEKLKKRIVGLVKRVFVFSVILRALRGFVTYLNSALKTSREFTAAWGQLKGALLTAFQPLWETILPYLTKFVQILSKVVLWIAAFIAYLTGKNLAKSAQSAKNLYDEADALDETGKAAKKAQKSLAAFDEINNISSEEDKGGRGSAGISAPTFDFDTAYLEKIQGIMKKIGDYVLAIALGLLAWKIASAFGASLLTCLGLFMAVAGLVLMVTGFIDAWKNGLNWENLTKMLIGATLLVGGLAIAFGPVGAAIGAIVAGIALLVIGIKEWIDTGELSAEACTAIVTGILLIGAGIALLTGSWIPLVIAAIVALIICLSDTYGQADTILAGIKLLFGGLVKFFKGVFAGDLKMALVGIGDIFEGLKWIVTGMTETVREIINSFLDWLDEKTHGKISGLIEWLRTFINNHIDNVSKLVSDTFNAIKRVFSGLVIFLTGVFKGDWAMAWEGIKNIFKGAWDGIVGIAKFAVNTVLAVVESMINGVIAGINWMINKINSIQSIKLPDWDILGEYKGMKLGFNIPSLSKVSIPRLAEGTVVPANREFLAMLGDNRHEREVVSPLSTIKQAVSEAMKETGGGNLSLKVYLDGKVVFDDIVERSTESFRRTGRYAILGE